MAITASVATGPNPRRGGVARISIPLIPIATTESIPGLHRKTERDPIAIFVRSEACRPAKTMRQIICKVFAYTKEISGLSHTPGTLAVYTMRLSRSWRAVANVPANTSEHPAMTPLCRATLCVSVVAEKNASSIPFIDMIGRYKVR